MDMEQRIEELEKRVAYLESRLASQQQAPQSQQPAQYAQPVQQPVRQPVTRPFVPVKRTPQTGGTYSANVQQPAPVQYTQPAASQPGTYAAPEAKKERDLGMNLGRYLLPTLAVALIILATFSFALLGWMILPDIGKFLLVGVFGAAFFAAGLVFRKKEHFKIYGGVLISIGAAVIYTDLILAVTVWTLFSFWVTSILLSAICIAAAIAGQTEGVLYLMIAYVGILINALFSGIYTASIGSSFSTVVAAGMILMTYVAVTGLSARKHAALSCGFAGLMTVVYRFLPEVLSGRGLTPEKSILLGFFAASVIYAYVLIVINKDRESAGLKIMSCISRILIPCVCLTVSMTEGLHLTAILAVLVICAVMSYISEDLISQTAVVCMAAFASAIQSNDNYVAIAYICVTAALYLLVLRKKEQISGAIAVSCTGVLYLLAMAFCSYGSEFIPEPVTTCLSVVFYLLPVAVTVMSLGVSTVVSDIASAFLMLSWCVTTGEVTSISHYVQAYILCTGLFCGYSFMTAGSRKRRWYPAVVSWVLLFYIMSEVRADSFEQPLLTAGMLLARTVCLCVLLFTVYYQLEMRRTERSKLYELCMATYTVMTAIALVTGYGAMFNNFAVSTALVLCSALFIIYGFRRKNAFYRNYGLILLIIAVAKIILIDMVSVTTWLKILMLLGSGLVCVFLSFLYNREVK